MNESLESSKKINQQESFEILLKRTKELAVPLSKFKSDEERLCCLNFIIQNTGYAISAEYILGIISSFQMTSIPDIPNFILGITDYRSKILSIFDLHLFFDYSPTNVSSDSNLILVSYKNNECGILVDKVYDVHSIPVSSIEKNISIIEKNAAKYLKGMIRIDGKLSALINIPGIFESERIIKLKDLSDV
ncbi:chemotaxis protein CheW [candidate division KSB1 bacterium]